MERVGSNRHLWDMLNRFQEGFSHLVAVEDEETKEIIGVVTLEDVIEELIKEEIYDENDHLKKERRLSKKIRLAKNFDLSSPNNKKLKLNPSNNTNNSKNSENIEMKSTDIDINEKNENHKNDIENYDFEDKITSENSYEIDISQINESFDENNLNEMNEKVYSPKKIPKVKFPEYEEKFYEDDMNMKRDYFEVG
jgi:hypothetical protein